MSDSPRLVRFLVGVQHRPAASILAVVATIFLLGIGFRAVQSDGSGFAWIVVSTCLATASAQIGARATSLWARLVVIGVGAGSTWPLTWWLFSHNQDSGWLAALVALMVAVPHAIASAAGRWQQPTSALAATVLALAAAALPAIAESLRTSSRGAGIACLLGWVLALQLAFRAAAMSPIRYAATVASATALGSLSGVAFAWAGQHRTPLAESATWFGGAWLVGALLVPLAHIGRSFTAVPLDHQIYADFGGAQV